MQRYILFSGETYYPSGGAGDLEGFFDSVEEAKEFFNAEKKMNLTGRTFMIYSTREL